MGFKRYDGTPIEIPTHKHSVEDTQIGGFTAYASYTNDGFMQKEDRIKLTSLKTKMDYLNDRLYNAVYFNEPKTSTLVAGSNFNSKVREIGSNATSIIFTKTAIPSDKISSATVVSTEDSESKAYMYLDNDTIYVSPEEDNGIIYANEDSSEMFYNRSSLVSIDFSNFDTSNVIDMYDMFRNCEFLTSLDLSKWNTSNVTSMHYMFYNCRSLTSLDLSNFDTSNVTNMLTMFFGCNKLTSIDLSNFDTSNVTSMSYMFSSCSSLTSIDLSNFDTSKVTSMSYMFNYCESLTSLDVSNFDTSNVTDMGSMFNGCILLTSLNLSNWNTSKVTNMRYMFQDSTKLSGEITIMNPNITSYDNMFYSCSTDTNAKFIVKYADGCKNMAQTLVNTKSSSSNVYLYIPSSTLISGQDFNDKLKSVGPNATSVVFTKTAIPSDKISTATVISTEYSEAKSYMYLDGDIVYISPENDNSTIYANSNCEYMFDYCTNLTSINFSNFNTFNVFNMRYMFYNCTSLTSLDLSNFDTSNVTDIMGLCCYCTSLSLLDLSNWDTSKVYNMAELFFKNEKLTRIIGLEKLNTSNVTNFNKIFFHASRLSGTFTIMTSNQIQYYQAFEYVAYYTGQLVINYTEECKDTAQKLVDNKYPSTCNVILGSLVEL